MKVETRVGFIERFASRYPEDERPLVRSVVRAAALAALGEGDNTPFWAEQQMLVGEALVGALEVLRAEGTGDAQ